MVGVAMSEDNVEIVRRPRGVHLIRAALRRRRSGRGLGHEHVPLFHGHEGIRRFLAAWLEPYDDWHMAVDEVLDAGGDQVVARVRQWGRPDGSDWDIHLHYGLVFSREDGLIRRIRAYATAAEALEAAGLPD
jgi:ketosteroid isomerase-like protein